MEDELERCEIQFESAIALAGKTQLLELGSAIGMEDLEPEMRKPKLMRRIRKHVQASWGDVENEQLDYMQRLQPKLDEMLAPSAMRQPIEHPIQQSPVSQSENYQPQAHESTSQENTETGAHP